MSLRWKIFLLSLFVAVFVGGSTAYVFAGAWQNLAKSYGIASVGLKLENFAQDASGETWALESRGDGGSEWITKPESVPEPRLAELGPEVISLVRQTRLSEGTFEIDSKVASGRYFVAFRERVNADAVSRTLQVVGIESSASFMKLSPWAAPFLGVVVLALAVAGTFGFLLAAGLNRDYLLIERALENIGAGRLKNLEVPQSQDPSVKRLTAALANTIQVLADKDQKIAQVSSLANEDPMTGVPNYRAFEDYVEGLMSGVFVPGSVPVLGIIDLDYFKKVNDNYGHQVGDFVLRETTRIIKETIRYEADNTARSPDFFGRYGGEEFVVIFTSVKADSVHRGAQRIVQKIKSTVLHVPKEIAEKGEAFDLSISCSIGLALWNGRTYSKEEWVKEADQALYEAKHSGRGRVVMIKPKRQEWL